VADQRPADSASIGAGSHVSGLLHRLGAHWLQRGWLSANGIVFPGGQSRPGVVIDTGYVSHADQTLALVRHALGDQPLGRIVNTHLHSDHCGGNGALQAAWPQAGISVPEGYRAALSPWNESLLSYRHTGQDCAPFQPDHYLSDGANLSLGGRSWQVHAAPGHDPDAMMFFEPEESVLISGDALWADRLAIIFPALANPGAGFDDAHRALDLIERLRPRWILPGHGPIFTDLHSALAQSRSRLEGFARDPQRHRSYAVRALVTYHMLERRQRLRADLVAWMVQTPIFAEALGCAGDTDRASTEAEAVLERLIADRVLQQRDGLLTMPAGSV